MSEKKKVTHAEAREILSRFNASHWNNGKERARYSIPANPDYDDDIRLGDYIEQAEATERELLELQGNDSEDERELLRLITALADSQHQEDLVKAEQIARVAILAHYRKAKAKAYVKGKWFAPLVRGPNDPPIEGPPQVVHAVVRTENWDESRVVVVFRDRGAAEAFCAENKTSDQGLTIDEAPIR